MTNEEILVAEKLITGMRDDMSLLAGTTDADKLGTLILEVASVGQQGCMQLWQILGTNIDSETPASMIRTGFYEMTGFAKLEAETHTAINKARLIKKVATWVPVVISGLDQLAQALKEKAGEPK